MRSRSLFRTNHVIRRVQRLSDHLLATEPTPENVQRFLADLSRLDAPDRLFLLRAVLPGTAQLRRSPWTYQEVDALSSPPLLEEFVPTSMPSVISPRLTPDAVDLLLTRGPRWAAYASASAPLSDAQFERFLQVSIQTVAFYAHLVFDLVTSFERLYTLATSDVHPCSDLSQFVAFRQLLLTHATSTAQVELLLPSLDAKATAFLLARGASATYPLLPRDLVIAAATRHPDLGLALAERYHITATPIGVDIPSPLCFTDMRRLLLYVPGLAARTSSKTPYLVEPLNQLYARCSDSSAVRALLTNPAACFADAISAAACLV